MTRAALVCLLAGVSSLAIAASAAQKPNFSGRWVIVSPPQGAGTEQVIKQDDKSVTTGTGVEGGRTTTYIFDGQEHRNALSMRGQEIVILSKAVWETNKLVVTTNTAYPNGMKIQTKEVWSLDDQGRLVIDYTETAEGQPPRSFKVIHTKKGSPSSESMLAAEANYAR